MTIDNHSAAIDTDFIGHVIKMDRPIEEIARIWQEIFMTLEISAIIHPLVYKFEIDHENKKLSAFLGKGLIDKPSFDDILQKDESKKAYYKYLVLELYRLLTGDSLSEDIDVFTYWCRQKSLGEVHSMSMCLICGCGMFMSDDGDSKNLSRIIKQQTLGEINVYNRKELIEKYKENGTVNLQRPDIRSFSHQ